MVLSVQNVGPVNGSSFLNEYGQSAEYNRKSNTTCYSSRNNGFSFYSNMLVNTCVMEVLVSGLFLFPQTCRNGIHCFQVIESWQKVLVVEN